MKSNLTEIINRTDKLHFRNYLLSPDTNKSQRDIYSKSGPKFSWALPPPPQSPQTTTTPEPPPSWELESDEISTNLNENGCNSNDTRITACNTQKSKNKITANK